MTNEGEKNQEELDAIEEVLSIQMSMHPDLASRMYSDLLITVNQVYKSLGEKRLKQIQKLKDSMAEGLRNRSENRLAGVEFPTNAAQMTALAELYLVTNQPQNLHYFHERYLILGGIDTQRISNTFDLIKVKRNIEFSQDSSIDRSGLTPSFARRIIAHLPNPLGHSAK